METRRKELRQPGKRGLCHNPGIWGEYKVDVVHFVRPDGSIDGFPTLREIASLRLYFRERGPVTPWWAGRRVCLNEETPPLCSGKCERMSSTTDFISHDGFPFGLQPLEVGREVFD